MIAMEDDSFKVTTTSHEATMHALTQEVDAELNLNHTNRGKEESYPNLKGTKNSKQQSSNSLSIKRGKPPLQKGTICQLSLRENCRCGPFFKGKHWKATRNRAKVSTGECTQVLTIESKGNRTGRLREDDRAGHRRREWTRENLSRRNFHFQD